MTTENGELDIELRFSIKTSGAGILVIHDNLKDTAVCSFFTNKERPEAVEAMAKVCMHALNAAVSKKN